jgi:hypothetical protein
MVFSGSPAKVMCNKRLVRCTSKSFWILSYGLSAVQGTLIIRQSCKQERREEHLPQASKCWGQRKLAKYRPASAIASTLFARGRFIVLSNWPKLSRIHTWRGVMCVSYSFGVICCPKRSALSENVIALCRQTIFEIGTVYLSNVRQIMVTLIIAGHRAWYFIM